MVHEYLGKTEHLVDKWVFQIIIDFFFWTFRIIIAAPNTTLNKQKRKRKRKNIIQIRS
jgi:hypothetical protein